MSTHKIIGGCRLSRPLVRIVIPFASNEADNGTQCELDLRDSILRQSGRGEVFDIEMVFVLQEKAGKVHTLQDWSPLENKVVIYNADEFDYPSTFHQAEEGFKHCLDSEFCMYMTANDTLAPFFIDSAMRRMGELSAKVVYADTLIVDASLHPIQCEKPDFEFLPFEWFKGGKPRGNPVPDVCLIDCSILELVPFESKWKRASFMIWWFRIWEEFGHLAFGYVNTIGCLYRHHENQASKNDKWRDEGGLIGTRWLKGRPWVKWTGYAGT